LGEAPVSVESSLGLTVLMSPAEVPSSVLSSMEALLVFVDLFVCEAISSFAFVSFVVVICSASLSLPSTPSNGSV
jgi:hypothetical protein